MGSIREEHAMNGEETSAVEALGALVNSVARTRSEVRREVDRAWKIARRAGEILNGAGARTTVTGNSLAVKVEGKSELKVTLARSASAAATRVEFDMGEEAQMPGRVDVTIEKDAKIGHIETIAIIDVEERLQFRAVHATAQEQEIEALNRRHIGVASRSAQSQMERDDRWKEARSEWASQVLKGAQGQALPADEEAAAKTLAEGWAKAMVRLETQS